MGVSPGSTEQQMARMPLDGFQEGVHELTSSVSYSPVWWCFGQTYALDELLLLPSGIHEELFEGADDREDMMNLN